MVDSEQVPRSARQRWLDEAEVVLILPLGWVLLTLFIAVVATSSATVAAASAVGLPSDLPRAVAGFITLVTLVATVVAITQTVAWVRAGRGVPHWLRIVEILLAGLIMFSLAWWAAGTV